MIPVLWFIGWSIENGNSDEKRMALFLVSIQDRFLDCHRPLTEPGISHANDS
jgi:hypothetical protein